MSSKIGKFSKSWTAEGQKGTAALIKLTLYLYITIYAFLSHVGLVIIYALLGLKFFNLKSYLCKVFDI